MQLFEVARRQLVAVATSVVIVAGCQASPASSPAASAAASPGAIAPSASPALGPLGSPLPGAAEVFARSLDDLGFRITLPTGWALATPSQVAAYWAFLQEQSAQIATNLTQEAAVTRRPVALLAYDGTEKDDRNPVVTCSGTSRGSISADDALAAGERDNLEGVKSAPGLVDTPTVDHISADGRTSTRIRWQQGDIVSIGYLALVDPLLITCVFRADKSAVSSRQAEFESIWATLASATKWSVTATIPVGVKPFDITAGGGYIWVADADSGEVSRIDARTNAVDAVDLRAQLEDGDNTSPFAIEYAGERLWVTGIVIDAKGEPMPGSLLVIDPPTGNVTASATVGGVPSALAVDFDAAWVANTSDGTVSRVDQDTLDVTTIKVGGDPAGIAGGLDAVWVVETGGDLVKIDPSTNKVIKSSLIGPELQTVVVGRRGVWVAGKEALYLVDAKTLGVIATLKGVPGAAGLVAEGGSIWAAESLGVLVHEIDESTAKEVQNVRLDTNSWDIVAYGGSLWVVQPAAAENKFADAKPGTVTRLDH